ncbi:MAG: flippase-like domain-containing protein [Desulfobulbaceae bacterium]|nr:flippase-like domain-containing protein [Desulfobulbaceae bacterium]
MSKKNPLKSILIKVVISFCFFGVLFSFVQTEKLFAIFSRINWFYFSLSFALVPVMLLASCLKWKLILDLHGEKIPCSKLLKIYLIGYLFSNILPSTFGGDVVRSYYSGKIINNQSFSAIAVFIERFTGIIMLLFLVMLAPLMHAKLYREPYIYIPGILALSLLLLMVWIWRVYNSMQILHRIAQQFIFFLYKMAELTNLKVLISVIHALEKSYLNVFKRLKKLRAEMTIAVSIIRKDTSLVVKLLLLTVGFYLLTLLNVYVSFMAFDIRPNFLEACALVPVILFVAQIPVTLLGNIGFYESVFVLYFLIIDIPGAETLAMGLLLRLKMILTGVAGYFVYITYSHSKNLGEEMRGIDQNM